MKRVTKWFFLAATLTVTAIPGHAMRAPPAGRGREHALRPGISRRRDQNVTTGFYDSSLPTPEYATPDVLRVVLYDQKNNRTAAERYLRNRSTDTRGTYFDGYIIAEPGDYRLLTYNFGTESTVIDQSHIYHGAMAYTNEISSVLKNSLSVRADDEERIVYVPDHLFVDRNETLHLDYGPDIDTLQNSAGEPLHGREHRPLLLSSDPGQRGPNGSRRP